MSEGNGPLSAKALERVVSFHGHLCPGLAMGVQASRLALREIGPSAKDEEVVAVVETDMCGVDGIQFLTGCTFGKGNLVHRDYGKNAYTFYRRSDGRASAPGRPRRPMRFASSSCTRRGPRPSWPSNPTTSSPSPRSTGRRPTWPGSSSRSRAPVAPKA